MFYIFNAKSDLDHRFVVFSISPFSASFIKGNMRQYVAKQVKECFELISLFLSMILPEYPLMATSDSDFHVKVKESLLMSRDEPILNKNETSLPLYLFD